MNRLDKYKKIKPKIIELFDKNKKIYGYRRITAELHKLGYIIKSLNWLSPVNYRKLVTCMGPAVTLNYQSHS